MLLSSPSVERLIEALQRIPGIGKRSAERIAFHLLGAPEDTAVALSDAIRTARAAIKRCSVCCNLTESDPCSVCRDDRRDHALICVVEQPAGAIAVERGHSYNGTYHVLHGVLNPLDGVGPDELTVQQLKKRVQDGGVDEVIVATNATAEGENTALYLAKQLGAQGVKVTRIAHGVPMGGGLEYADDTTLSHALKGRTAL